MRPSPLICSDLTQPPNVQQWLAKHRSFVMHFEPIGSSWLNVVERFFRDITAARWP